MEAQSNAETSGELGPLKYISKLSEISMDKIINWFILIIVFVFDPLAISLVIAANFAFNKLKQPTQLAIYDEKPTESKVEPKSTRSWYNYVPPVFKRKNKDDEIKTY